MGSRSPERLFKATDFQDIMDLISVLLSFKISSTDLRISAISVRDSSGVMPAQTGSAMASIIRILL